MSGTMQGGAMTARDRGRRDPSAVVQSRARFSCTSCRGACHDHALDEYVGYCIQPVLRPPLVTDSDNGGEGRRGKS